MQLVTRLQRQSRGRSLALLLVDVGIEEDAVQLAVADVSGLQFSKLKAEDVSLELVDKLGIGWCKDHDVLPVRIDGMAYIASSTVDELFLTDYICG